MKRLSVEEGSTPKRPRLESADDNLFDETRRKTAKDLLDPATYETGNIEAKLHAIYPCIGAKRQLNLEMHEHGNTYRFLVLIASTVDKLHPFPFRFGDRICLSLKGAEIRARAQSSAPCYLPVALTFKDGIAIKLMSGPEAGKVFNTRSPPQVPSNERTSSTSEQTSSSPSNKFAPTTVTMTLPPSANDPVPNHRQGALAMKAGMKLPGDDIFLYIPIRNIEQGLGFFDVIGIVTSAKPLRSTRSQEWCRVFSIVDPSCMEDDLDIVNHNFTINCFQKKHTEWLPQAEVGDIVIFRRLKATSYGDGRVNGTGYGDQLHWVTYDTQTRRFRDPDGKDAPHSVTSDKLVGHAYSPYYKPSMQGKEAEYCAQLANWWQAIQTNQQGITIMQCAARPSREHHLISEVTPHTFPQGYFDCTVEILHSYENNSGPNTVYVTDYTVNPYASPTQANWCSPKLSPYVFRIEMWDDAGQLAKTMQPGEFWSLPNARVMVHSYHHLFGKLVETRKSKQLDEAQNGVDIHFRALLERKKKFEQGEGASGSSARFDNKLIEDIDEEVRFFHCTVEVLRVDLAFAEEPLVYVTDYTFNPSLVDPAEPAPWALGLDRRIVKIVLEGGQTGRARDLQPGAMYRIKNLRLIRRTGVKGAFGRLGGNERLIIAANDRENEESLILLDRRKEKWKLEMKRDGVSIESAGAPPTELRPPIAKTSENLTVKQAIASTVCPNTFTFVARVADFYPFDLHQAAFLLCTKCGTNLRPAWKRCVDCDGMLNTHCKWFYGLVFRLEDDEGNNIIVSASGKKCQLLSGLPPADLEGDEDAFDRFIARLQPAIGNLRQVHDTRAKKKYLPVDTPKMRFTVESWNAKDKRSYGLLECAPL